MNTIVLSSDYNYRDKIETTIKSILDHTNNVNIHVINSDIPHEWFVNVNQYTNQIGVSVIDEKIDPGQLNDIKPSDDRISRITYGKFLIPKLIDADKVLYLDSDVVVENNLKSLFDTALGDNMLAAVCDYRAPEQFNPGVMLINNKKWREENISDKILEISRKAEKAYDQDIVNDLFKDKVMELDPAYNYQIGYENMGYWVHRGPIEAYLDDVAKPKIIHYITDDKPFNLVSLSSLRDTWWKYNNLEWSQIVNKYTKFDARKIGKSKFDAEALLFTRIAETKDLEELVKRLPNVHFNIAAYTPMAWLLTGLSKYDNVSLYPSVVANRLTKLIDNCDVYLDTTYGSKEPNVFENIIHQGKPIVAFESTQAHDLNYDNYYVFKDNEMDKMAKKIESYIGGHHKTSFDNMFNIKVKNTNQTLDLILKHKKSVIRFGDGEFDYINGKSIVYQEYDEELAKRLKEIALRGNYNNTIVCLPDVFRKLNRYGRGWRGLYVLNFFPENYDLLKQIEKNNKWYGSAFISRPYINLIDKSKSVKSFEQLKQIWKDRDILIVEGNLTRSGEGNDLFDGAKSIKRIICPAKNAYAKIDQIESAIRENAEDRLVLVMLGPTAKVVIDDLQDLDNQMIDIGHIDSEYEWFKRRTLYTVPLPDKHTAEFGLGVTLENDQDFENEILAKIE